MPRHHRWLLVCEQRQQRLQILGDGQPVQWEIGHACSLTFYELAPSNYSWVGGGSGDNDPPSKYGVRVTKNGTEVFKQADIATTSSWSLETIDFTGDADFTVTSQTTFNVEILGYCRQTPTVMRFGILTKSRFSVARKIQTLAGRTTTQLTAKRTSTTLAGPRLLTATSPFVPATTFCLASTPTAIHSWTGPNGFTASTNDITVSNSVNPCQSWQLHGYRKRQRLYQDQDHHLASTGYRWRRRLQRKRLPTEITWWFATTPGSPCNDGNANTTNDVVTANGCGCAGTVQTALQREH